MSHRKQMAKTAAAGSGSTVGGLYVLDQVEQFWPEGMPGFLENPHKATLLAAAVISIVVSAWKNYRAGTLLKDENQNQIPDWLEGDAADPVGKRED